MMWIRILFSCTALRNRGSNHWARLLLVLLFATPFSSQAESVGPPGITARAVVLMNADTGEIVFSRQPYRRLPNASTTKVLTSLLTMERINPNARMLVSAGAANTPPSRLGLKKGESLTTQDLLYGLMLKSGNDAAEVIAEAIGGSVAGFANLMNIRARQIGARNSHFRNPHGLPDDNHYSTAYDQAVIFRYAMRNPLFAELVRTRSASLRIQTPKSRDGWRTLAVRNSNRLLGSFEGARGGKTGYTFKAKRCFVGEVSRGGTRLIVAVLGSTQLWGDVKALFDYGFSQHEQILAAKRESRVSAFEATVNFDTMRESDESEIADPFFAKRKLGSS